jgi:hypothetical protein
MVEIFGRCCEKSSAFFVLIFSELLQNYQVDSARSAARVVDVRFAMEQKNFTISGPPTEVQAIYDSSVWHGKA